MSDRTIPYHQTAPPLACTAGVQAQNTAPSPMVFGLNSAANTAQSTPCSDTTPPTPIDSPFLAMKAMKLFVEAKQTDTWGKEFATTVSETESGPPLFTAVSARTGMTTVEMNYKSPSGAVLCTVQGKGGFTTAGATVTKGGSEFASIGIQKSLTSAAATYTVGASEVYKADKYTTLYFFMTVLDQDGKIVAKASQTTINNKKMEVEVGAGVDILAVMILCGTMGAAPGGGSAAGGLAGAGVTT